MCCVKKQRIPAIKNKVLLIKGLISNFLDSSPFLEPVRLRNKAKESVMMQREIIRTGNFKITSKVKIRTGYKPKSTAIKILNPRFIIHFIIIVAPRNDNCYNKFMNKKRGLLFILFLFAFSNLFGKAVPDDTIYLWKNIPSMKRNKSVMYYHRPEPYQQKTDIAVIILPGGSYHHLGLYGEGYTSGSWFSSKGITSFTLRYRTSEDGYHYPAMLEDVQRAIQIVRENADKYNINPNKIGVIGYSAGGHLTLMSGIFSSQSELEKLGITSTVDLRPDFLIPVYPVVSMQDDIAHKWSRKSLLGKKYTKEQQDKFSLEMQVPQNMPPTYIVVAKDDSVVNYQNSVRMYAALQEKQIPGCRFELYDWGEHGFGMTNSNFMKTFHWNEKILDWLKEIGIMN